MSPNAVERNKSDTSTLVLDKPVNQPRGHFVVIYNNIEECTLSCCFSDGPVVVADIEQVCDGAMYSLQFSFVLVPTERLQPAACAMIK